MTPIARRSHSGYIFTPPNSNPLTPPSPTTPPTPHSLPPTPPSTLTASPTHSSSSAPQFPSSLSPLIASTPPTLPSPVTTSSPYLYIFGGFSSNSNMNLQSIERLRLAQPLSDWEAVSVSNNSCHLLSSNMLTLPHFTEQDKLVLLGGSYSHCGLPQNSAMQVDHQGQVTDLSLWMEDEEFSK